MRCHCGVDAFGYKVGVRQHGEPSSAVNVRGWLSRPVRRRWSCSVLTWTASWCGSGMMMARGVGGAALPPLDGGAAIAQAWEGARGRGSRGLDGAPETKESGLLLAGVLFGRARHGSAPVRAAAEEAAVEVLLLHGQGEEGVSSGRARPCRARDRCAPPCGAGRRWSWLGRTSRPEGFQQHIAEVPRLGA